VTVLTGTDVACAAAASRRDALRTVPGVAVAQSAGPGAQTSVFMRGGESDYVQVLIDGIQVNNPGGAFDWAHLRTSDIERIEIVRGPASVLYGSDAVAGVVQIFTRAGGATRVTASVGTERGDKADPAADGAFDTHAFDATITGSGAVTGAARVSYGATAGHTRSTGLHAFNNDYDNTVLSGNLRLSTDASHVALTARRTDNDYHFPTNGAGFVIDANQVAHGASTTLGLDLGHFVHPGLELRALATLHRAETGTDNPPDTDEDGTYRDEADQARRTIDARANITLPADVVLTLGAEREWQRVETGYESTSSFGTFADTTADTRVNTGGYAQLHGTARGIAFTVGGRVDDNEAFGTFATGRAAVSWQPVDRLRLHAAAGTAFKEPTFYENFATGFVRGNRDLEPERARSFEAGMQYSLAEGRGMVGATWFDQRFRNLIQYTAAPPADDAPNYFNVGSARARGVELAAELAPADALTLTTSYTYTSSIATDAGFGDDPAFRQDERLLRRPTHQANAGVVWTASSSLRALLDVRYAGDRTDLDFTDPENWSGVRTTLDGYTVFDAGAVYSVLQRGGTGLDLTLRVRNVLDTEYQEIYNFPTAGRVFQLGVRGSM
jgi:vitamin B12 transporter